MKRKIDRVYFELTTKCNLRCRHCFNDNVDIGPQSLDKLAFAKFYKIIKNRTDGIVLTGGEPFLYPHLEEILDQVKSEKVVITTNATVVSKEHLERILKQYPNIFLQMSFDGMTKETFEAVRGPGTYEKVRQAVDYLSAKGNSGRIGLSISVLSCNIHEVLSIIDYAEEKHLHSVHFPTLIMEGRCAKESNLLPEVSMLNDLEDQLLKLAVDHESMQISINTLNRIAGWISSAKNQDCLSNATLKITADGKIMPCPVAWRQEESLGEIIRISSYKELLERLNHVQAVVKEIRQCRQCTEGGLCAMNFCEYCSIHKNDNIYGKQYRCSNLKHHINNIRKEEQYGKHVNGI